MSDEAKPVPATSLDMPFADGTYHFRLGLKQIAELQTKCGCGIGALYARVLAGRYHDGETTFAHLGQAQYHVEDLTETIRLGLIGGGRGEVNDAEVSVTPIVALRLVETYVVGRPLAEAWATAAAILHALIEGYAPKKKEDQEAVTEAPASGSDTQAPS